MDNALIEGYGDFSRQAGMRVLIVDDHILFRQGLVGLLEDEPGFDVTGQAGSCQEAIELANIQKPDLILMDFNLPDGTGADATRRILEEDPKTKVVFLTMYAQDEIMLEAVRSGAKGYLLKNLPINKLLDSLRAVEGGEAAISRTMTRRIMEELSRTSAANTAQPGALAKLTEREFEVLQEIASGASNREIAQRLVISENTVKRHVSNILAKLELPNRQAAAKVAKQAGL